MTLAVICGEEPPSKTMKDGAHFFSGKREISNMLNQDRLARYQKPYTVATYGYR